jgi:hypothetical protein
MLLERGLESGMDDWMGRGQGEDLLGVVRRAITATDFARDHRRSDRVLGAPVGRIDARVPQEPVDGGNSTARCAAKQ